MSQAQDQGEYLSLSLSCSRLTSPSATKASQAVRGAHRHARLVQAILKSNCSFVPTSRCQSETLAGERMRSVRRYHPCELTVLVTCRILKTRETRTKSRLSGSPRSRARPCLHRLNVQFPHLRGMMSTISHFASSSTCSASRQADFIRSPSLISCLMCCKRLIRLRVYIKQQWRSHD